MLIFLPVPGSALSARFFGPYIVIKSEAHTPDRKSQTCVCHINMLMAYHAREKPLVNTSEHIAGPAISSGLSIRGLTEHIYLLKTIFEHLAKVSVTLNLTNYELG